jgi:hypothetical protein
VNNPIGVTLKPRCSERVVGIGSSRVWNLGERQVRLNRRFSDRAFEMGQLPFVCNFQKFGEKIKPFCRFFESLAKI